MHENRRNLPKCTQKDTVGRQGPLVIARPRPTGPMHKKGGGSAFWHRKSLCLGRLSPKADRRHMPSMSER